MSVSEDAGPTRGLIVRSHIDWRGETSASENVGVSKGSEL